MSSATAFSYFEPQLHESIRPRELDGDTAPHSVVVVGAGPVGLTAALDLAQRGISVTVIEQDNKVSLGSRAVALSYRSQEILARLGLIDRFLAAGLDWESGRSFYRDTEICNFAIPQASDAQFPGLLNLQQPFIETYILDACLAHPLIEIRWSTTFLDIDNREDGATLTVESPYGTYDLHADWVVASDGARSEVRKKVGTHLEGTTYSNMFVIVDLRLKRDRPTERLCWFDPPAFPGSTVLLHKQPHDIWRVDYQISADVDPDEATKPETVIPKVRQHLDWIGETADWEIEWISLYRAHALSLPRYRESRVLFVGDAAHLLPIFGVRGLNSGMVDAANLTWKLAAVVRGEADDSLLDTFDEEQRDVWAQNRDYAHLSTLFMTPGSYGTVLVRDAALDLALVDENFRALADPRYSTPLDYRVGPMMLADRGDWDGGVVSGGLLPNKPVATADGAAFLNDVTGPDWALLSFDSETADTGIAGLAHVTAAADSDLGRLLDARPGSAYLIRPDRHVLTRWREWTPADVQAVLDQFSKGDHS